MALTLALTCLRQPVKVIPSCLANVHGIENGGRNQSPELCPWSLSVRGDGSSSSSAPFCPSLLAAGLHIVDHRLTAPRGTRQGSSSAPAGTDSRMRGEKENVVFFEAKSEPTTWRLRRTNSYGRGGHVVNENEFSSRALCSVTSPEVGRERKGGWRARRVTVTAAIREAATEEEEPQQEGNDRKMLQTEDSAVLLRQLFEKESSTYTYILSDPLDPKKRAVIIDPVDRAVERDLELIEQLGLTLVFALNTHVHADHVTGTGKIKSLLPQVKSIISAASGAQADIHVHNGDRIRCGGLTLEVLSTPGHTQGCVTYVTKARPQHRLPPSHDEDLVEDGVYPTIEGEQIISSSSRLMAFVGDALLIRGCGRTDFQGGDARQLYRSVHSRIFTLPEHTLLYPAHDYKGFSVTTVGEEMKYNPRLTKTEDEFTELMGRLDLAYPKMMDVAVPANMVCGLQERVLAS